MVESPYNRLLILFIAILFSHNVYAGDVKCFLLKPPEQPLANVKKIAILDFTGDYSAGKKLTDYMISALLEERRGITSVKSGFIGLGRTKKELLICEVQIPTSTP